MVLIILGLQSERYEDTETPNLGVIRDFEVWFDVARQKLLREFNWEFCVTTVEVEAVTNLTPDQKRVKTSSYYFIYQLPDNALGLADANSFEFSGDGYDDNSYDLGSTIDSVMKFRRIRTTPYMLTNQSASSADIIEDVKDVSQYSPEFAMLLAYEIALHIAPTVRSSREVKNLSSYKRIMEDRVKYIASHDVVNRRMM